MQDPLEVGGGSWVVGGAYREKQGWDRGATLDVDHGQQAGEVTFPGAGEEQTA